MKKLLTEFYELCKDGICQDLLTEREKTKLPTEQCIFLVAFKLARRRTAMAESILVMF